MRRIALVILLLLGLGLAPVFSQDKPDKGEKKKTADEEDELSPEDLLSLLNEVDPDSPNLKPPASLDGEKKQRFDEAVAAFFKARSAAYARSKSAKRDMEAAVALLKKCQGDDARNALPGYYIGIAYQLLGEPKRAVAPLLSAVSINSKFHEAEIELGDTYEQLDKPKDSEEHYKKALSLKPDSSRAQLALARTMITEGKFKDANDAVLKVLDRNKRHPIAKSYRKKLRLVLEGPSDWPQKFTKETANYIVRTPVSQEFADQVAQHAELIRKLYQSIFKEPIPAGGPKKFSLVVYADQKQYMDSGAPANTGGYYDPLFRQLFFYRYPKWEDTTLVLYHEGFHQFLHPYLPNAPQWFNEGLGDYFGPSQYVKEGKVEGMKTHPNRWRLSLIQQVLQQNGNRPMSELMVMSQAQLYDEETVAVNYAQSWSFIYFLCEYDNRKYFPILGRYFKELRKGKDLSEAYGATFGKEDMTTLEAEWKRFILSLH